MRILNVSLDDERTRNWDIYIYQVYPWLKQSENIEKKKTYIIFIESLSAKLS